ncbi:hypothetical protein [Paenibacillus mesotrionivorans]|uniref:Uncharacterized protein n=2 Tax=Paenibacillus TaxID=44249 RepID=A0ACC7NWL6_9BACL
MAELVTELDEVVVNVKQFNADLANGEYIEGKLIAEKLSEFKHWYYISELDMFGPSKYIGYKTMICKDYSVYNDGRETEKVLKKWFMILAEDDSLYTSLWVKLNDLHYEHGKNLRKNAEIHILK